MSCWKVNRITNDLKQTISHKYELNNGKPSLKMGWGGRLKCEEHFECRLRKSQNHRYFKFTHSVLVQ